MLSAFFCDTLILSTKGVFLNNRLFSHSIYDLLYIKEDHKKAIKSLTKNTLRIIISPQHCDFHPLFKIPFSKTSIGYYELPHNIHSRLSTICSLTPHKTVTVRARFHVLKLVYFACKNHFMHLFLVSLSLSTLLFYGLLWSYHTSLIALETNIKQFPIPRLESKAPISTELFHFIDLFLSLNGFVFFLDLSLDQGSFKCLVQDAHVLSTQAQLKALFSDFKLSLRLEHATNRPDYFVIEGFYESK